MASKKIKRIPPPPQASEPDTVKAEYYERHDPMDLVDAGYFQEEGVFEGDKCIVDLKPERGLVNIPIEAQVARQLHRAARRFGCTPSDLATRWLAEHLPPDRIAHK